MIDKSFVCDELGVVQVCEVLGKSVVGNIEQQCVTWQRTLVRLMPM